jgi:hypothetical protein
MSKTRKHDQTDDRQARRVRDFYSTIFTTDEELLDLLPTDALENRLRILRTYRNTPLRYRTVITGLLDARAA